MQYNFSGLQLNKYLAVKLLIFSYPSVLRFALGAQQNRLMESVLLSTHNICFCWDFFNKMHSYLEAYFYIILISNFIYQSITFISPMNAYQDNHQNSHRPLSPDCYAIYVGITLINLVVQQNLGEF